MKEYVDKNAEYAAKVANRKLFGEVTPEAEAIASKSKQQSEMYGRIYKMAPHLSPGVIFSLVNSGASDQTVAKVGLAALAVEKAKAEEDKGDRGFWGDVWAVTKTGTRWASAFGQLPFDIANTFGSSVLSIAPNPTQKAMYEIDFKNPFRKGWFASTEFGSALMNPTETGEGIFGVGGKAGEGKSRRQMDFAGSIPLTIEAGAGENQAFEADPDDINTLAMQILATKDISYEEAYDEANRIIRSNARMALTAVGVSPLALPVPKISSLKIGFGPNGMPTMDPERQKFGDIGTPEYAMTSAIAGIAMAAVTPDATALAWQKVAKPLFAYAKGIKYVDDAGNFVMDSRNIAQNGAEAAHMANIDALNVLANDFEVAGIAAGDAAVETLTPQSGTWYHGSKSGPIEGDFVSIEDPRYPTPEGNLIGPGLYITEANPIGTTYLVLNDKGTRVLTTEEQAIYDGLIKKVNPDALATPRAGIGLSEADLPEGASPGTLYRFVEKEGSAPVLINPFEPLDGVLDPEVINQLANLWVDTSRIDIPGLELLDSKDGIRSLFESVNAEELIKSLHNDVVDVLNRGGIDMAHNGGDLRFKTFSQDSSFVQRAFTEKFSQLLTEGKVNPFEMEFTLNASTVQARLMNHFIEFTLENGRGPTSIDELKSFKGTLSFDEIASRPVSASVGDEIFSQGFLGQDAINLNNPILINAPKANRISLLERIEAKISELESMPEAKNASEFSNLYGQEYNLLTRIRNSLTFDYNIGSSYLDDFFRDYSSSSALMQMAESIDPRVLRNIINSYPEELREPFMNMVDEISGNFNSKVASRIDATSFSDETKALLQPITTVDRRAWYDAGSPSNIFMGGVPQNSGIRSWLSINTWLGQNGVDGYFHTGGLAAGAGDYLHKVRVMFDPMKHLDIADILTGERLPVNEAINLARESGELATRAGELRTQADEMQALRDAGHIPGYGDMVDPETFNSFFTQSRAGRYAADKIWDVVEKSKLKDVSFSKETQWYELWEMFDGKLPLNILDDILKAETKSEMVGIINKHVGYTPGLSNISDLNFSLSKTFDRLKAVTRVDTIMEKASELAGPLFGRSPKSTTLDIFGSPRAQLQALKDLDAFIKTGVRGSEANITSFGWNQRKVTLAQFAEAMRTGNRDYLFSISKTIASIVSDRVLRETGDVLEAKAASDMWSTAFDAASGRGIYSVSEAGLRTDNGYAAVLADNGQYELRGMEHGGPALLSELQQTPLELPDVQQLRRMTSWMGVFTGQQGLQRVIKKSEFRTNALKKFGVDLSKKDLDKLGELRIPIRLVDFAMTKVWKNAKKFSFAYGLRNTMEAQARLAFSDMDNAFTHPIDHMLVATHNRLPDDIALGEEFNPEGWRGLGKAHEAAGEGYREMLSSAYYGSDGRMDMVTSQFRNSDFVVISKNDPTKWAKAGGYELRQLFNDPIARRLAGGASVDEVIKWLNSDDVVAQKALREIKNTMSNGEVFYDSAGFARIVPVDPTPANIRLRIESMQKERLSLKTGSDPLLTEVVSNGTFNGADAFNPDGSATKDLLNYLESQVTNSNLPTFYKGRGTDPKLLKVRASQFDQAVRMFFDGLMGRAHNILDRSPLWRQEYTKEVNRLAVLMSPEAAAEMKQLIIDRTAHYADMAKSKGFARTFTIKDYLGKNIDADELFDSLDNAKGWMSRDEIHAYANALTLDKIEGLLFDASARNSITDAARIVSPFGAAWAEVTKTWVGLLAKNPDKIISAGRKYEILNGNKESEVLRNKGLLHKDPISGDMMYSLPMSGSVFKLFNKITGGEDSGSNYNLQAPLKGMNMAFNFTPGFSPIVGFPIGKLMYSSPKLRDYATFFFPYGASKAPTDFSEYAPGWLSKIINGLVGNPRSAGVYADTLSEVIRVEMATGKYDLSIPEQRKQFDQEAEHKARILTMMRGIGQALGPSSPSVEAKVRTKSGDVFSGFLTAEFHKLQSEDYDTAVERFLHMYGEETFGFMAGKTKSLMSGVEASSEFAKWELDNAELFDTPYGDIAGYFAPKGSNYDHAAWLYQINTGKRERVPPIPTQVEMAEYVLGMHKYREFVRMAGPRPNSAVRLQLAQQKALLEKEYPGMVTQSVMDVTQNEKNMKMLRLATEDPRLKNNETVSALKEYLDLRDLAMVGAKAAKTPWGSDNAAGLRAGLRFQGERLVQETPEFARVFDRLLLPELDK